MISLQGKRFKNSLKRSLKALNIDVNNWETSAMNRPTWRHTLAIGVLAAETCRTVAAQGKRADRRLEPCLHRLPHLQTSASHVVANSELVSASPVTCEPINNSRIS